MLTKSINSIRRTEECENTVSTEQNTNRFFDLVLRQEIFVLEVILSTVAATAYLIVSIWEMKDSSLWMTHHTRKYERLKAIYGARAGRLSMLWRFSTRHSVMFTRGMRGSMFVHMLS